MDTNQLLEQIKHIVRTEVQTETAPIKKQLDQQSKQINNLGKGQTNLEKRQTNLEKGQINLEKRQINLETGQTNLEKRQINLEKHQINLEKRQTNLEKGQTQLHTAVAQNTSMIEALKEGQESSTAAIRADIQNLGTKMIKYKKETDTRLTALEEYTGQANPTKH